MRFLHLLSSWAACRYYYNSSSLWNAFEHKISFKFCHEKKTKAKIFPQSSFLPIYIDLISTLRQSFFTPVSLVVTGIVIYPKRLFVYRRDDQPWSKLKLNLQFKKRRLDYVAWFKPRAKAAYKFKLPLNFLAEPSLGKKFRNIIVSLSCWKQCDQTKKLILDQIWLFCDFSERPSSSLFYFVVSLQHYYYQNNIHDPYWHERIKNLLRSRSWPEWPDLMSNLVTKMPESGHFGYCMTAPIIREREAIDSVNVE